MAGCCDGPAGWSGWSRNKRAEPDPPGESWAVSRMFDFAAQARGKGSEARGCGEEEWGGEVLFREVLKL